MKTPVIEKAAEVMIWHDVWYLICVFKIMQLTINGYSARTKAISQTIRYYREEIMKISEIAKSRFIGRIHEEGRERTKGSYYTDICYAQEQLIEYCDMIADAYPEVVYKTERVQARLAAIKAETERMRQEAEKHLEAQAEKAAAGLEPVHIIRAELIGKQDELIAMLYDEQTASNEMKVLKAEIDRQKERLEKHAFVKHQYGKRTSN